MQQFDVHKIREDFPLLKKEVYDKPLVYFDNAATTQKPQVVIDTITDYYRNNNANIHRGVHYLSRLSTQAFEEARQNVQQYINAAKPFEVIFTKGTTDSVNLLAYSFGKTFIKKGDEIIISALEHHSNLVPWQILCEEKKAHLHIVPVDANGEFMFEEFEKLLNENTRLVAVTHASNALGTVVPIKKVIQKAHAYDIPVMIDGAQGIPHFKIDVQELDCDFYAFSGHKFYAPMGVGILYGKEKYLNEMQPYQLGGEMVDQVSFQKTTFNELPFKFEAGTPNVEAVLGLNAAINYVEQFGIENIAQHEKSVLAYATEKLQKIEGLKIIGQASEKVSVLSFVIDHIHPYDAGTIIDKLGIAIRTGNHCAQPVLDHLGLPGTIRASFAMYNTKAEVDRLVEAVKQVKKMFA